MTDAEAIWAAKSDEELLEAAREIGEFTEEGERVIKAELARRNLPPPDPPIGRCSRCERSIYRNHPGDECSQCGEPLPPELMRTLESRRPDVTPVPVLRSADAGLIAFAKSLLESEGIAHFVRGENVQDLFGIGRLGGYNYITGLAELCVPADDAERARFLLDGLGAVPLDPAKDPDDDA